MKKESKNSVSEEWKKHIMDEKGYTETCAEWMAGRLEKLIVHLQYGHALIAYHKQNGEFCLVEGTLIGYEHSFGKQYNAEQIKSTLVYWNVEQQGWRTFQVENFLEWKPFI